MIKKNGLNIVFKKGYEETFKDFVIPEDAHGSDTPIQAYGRGPLISLPLDTESDERMVVRKCVRGGVLGPFLKDKYLNHGAPRPLKELNISEFAQAQGIPTPDILAIVIEQDNPFFYKGALAMREIRPSKDLQTELLTLGCSPENQAIMRKRRSASLLGCLIAKMHAAGIYHADLHLKNILVAEEESRPKLYVLDLDAARIFRSFSDFRRCLNLLRLYRSVQKVNKRSRVITRTDMLRFLRSYAEESSRSVRGLAAKLERMLPVWRLKWKLSDVLGV